MGSGFYLKMAVNNIKRNKKIYLPYIIAATIMVSIFFIVNTFIYTDGLNAVPDSQSVQTVFTMGNMVLGIFSVIFIFYVNSFLIKKRTKEFGLYGILGLEQRHIGKVIFLENLITMGVSIIFGIILSLVFGKLIFMALLKVMQTTKGSTFAVPVEAYVIMLILFAGIFVLTTIYNLFKVRTANPIDLLKSENMGEKKIRFVIPMTIIGFIVLGWAYYTALTLGDSMQAVIMFFPLAIAVMVGTYLLFYVGTNLILKILRKNKKIYYKSTNFVAISGLFYRMKQNAAGLASICMLSIMLLVTISLTTSLYIGTEDAVSYNNPHDMVIGNNEDYDLSNKADRDKDIEDIAQKYDLRITQNFINLSESDNAILKGNEITQYDPSEITNYNELVEYGKVVYLLTPEEYTRATGEDVDVKEGEVVYVSADDNKFKVLHIGDKDYRIDKYINNNIFIKAKNTKDIYDILLVVNEKDYDNIANTIFPDDVEPMYYNIINYESTSGTEDNQKRLEFSKEVESLMTQSGEEFSFMSIDSNREGAYTLFGGLMFIGVFFSIVFLSATILIIYFKQVSEGYDDKENFEILQKVGMDDREVKRTINKQIMIVFFLPLVMTFIHIIFASNLIIKFINAFMIMNNPLTITCIAVSALIFAVVYIVVYRMTARVYYNIVKW